jgi:large subunit ribosomal protein L29
MKQNADKARGLDSAELAKLVRDSAEQMFRLRFQMSMGQMEGVKKLRSLRKERARMLTVLRERELHREPAPKPAVAAPGVAEAATDAKPAAKAAKPKQGAPKKPAALKAKKQTAPRVEVKPKAALKVRKSSKG